MKKSLLIVESPAKARTIGKYLGPEFEVKASVGHIRDLPANRLGVNIENEFTPEYVTISGKKKIIDDLKKAAKDKEIIYLGPDPDREGEAIAWHIAQALEGRDREFRRVLFHELTPNAIRRAIENPEELSIERFESQQARRILDRLVGYQISPLLWGRVKRGLSAGRVQSVALRIIAERERAIFAFQPEEYWSLTARLATDGQEFSAALTMENQKKIKLKTGDQTQEIISALRDASFTVDQVDSKQRKRNPLPPYTTSQLQQDAFRRLNLPTARTMALAQQLYEGMSIGREGSVGLITYMRTDSVRVAGEAVNQARDLIGDRFGREYLPSKPRGYRNKKGSQDAHEAIRPTSALRTPDQLKSFLSPQHHALYELIWRRFVASQMKPAEIDQTSVDIRADVNPNTFKPAEEVSEADNSYIFRATGSVTKFDGFLKLYGYAGPEEELPHLDKGMPLECKELLPKQHFTQPPPRFTEATLVKELEENGIGRPSTYASIISTLKNKEYVLANKNQLVPTELGFLVNDLLVENFPRIMDVEFTAGMENDLDEIEEGQSKWKDILDRFYQPFEKDLHRAEREMLSLKRDGLKTDLKCEECGSTMVLKWGRHGPFLSCSRYPECKNAVNYERDEKGRIKAVRETPSETEEVCEKCGRPMVVKKGRHGSFLACSGYPNCKNAKPLNGDGENELPPLPEGVDQTCEKCGSSMEVKRSRMGNLFIACSNYPKCKNAKSFPLGVNCPRKGCDGELVERSSRKGIFYGCSQYPKCKFKSSLKPVNQPCPACGSSYLIETHSKKTDPPSSSVGLKCPNKDCDYTTEVEAGKSS